MANILGLLAAVFLFSYILNLIRHRPHPAKDALIPTSIIAAAMLILGGIVYLSIS